MAHTVEYVDELAEAEWAFVRTKDDEMRLFIRRDAVCPRVLMEAWAAYRESRRAG